MDSRQMAEELEKWNRYYASIPLEGAEDEPSRLFHEELVGLVQELLPDGGRILEAGCGAGRHSLALARLGRYDVSLLDFSPEALRHARGLFEREGLSAHFLESPAHEPGEAEYDLVFNAGVLEHHDLEGQAAILKGMASRSRRFVLALVPNRLCYWYWLWRVHLASRGAWPYGYEAPLADLTQSFDAAGLRTLGQRFMGASWTESLISGIAGLDDSLRNEFLAIHRSPRIPPDQRSYLLAALGTIEDGQAAVPLGWSPPRALPENVEIAAAHALLTDMLPAKIARERELGPLSVEHFTRWLDRAVGALDRLEASDALARRLAERLKASESELRAAAAGLEEFRRSRAYQLGRFAARVRREPVKAAVASFGWLAGNLGHEPAVLQDVLGHEDPLASVAANLEAAAQEATGSGELRPPPKMPS